MTNYQDDQRHVTVHPNEGLENVIPGVSDLLGDDDLVMAPGPPGYLYDQPVDLV